MLGKLSSALLGFVLAKNKLTHKCNLKCIHCYGDYGSDNCSEMPLNRVLSLLKDLKAMGIKIIELTGGDISVYPYLLEVLEEIKRLNFDFFILLTNGVNLKKEIKDFLIANKENAFIQIDLHSLKSEYLLWFTKRNNILHKIQMNIEELVNSDVKIRVATIVTNKNVDELERIADWVYNSGVKTYIISPVIKMGRGLVEDSDLYIDSIKNINILNEQLQNIFSKYKNFLTENKELNKNKNNCGCITSNVSIAPDGRIKLCVMDNLGYFNSSIGNVFENNVKSIYDDNMDFIQELFYLKPPSYESENCSSCINSTFCTNCILRAMLKVNELGNNCSWYNYQVPKTIKKQFSVENAVKNEVK